MHSILRISAKAVLKGMIVGAIANYIGASIGGLIKGAIPTAEVATLPLQKVTATYSNVLEVEGPGTFVSWSIFDKKASSWVRTEDPRKRFGVMSFEL